MNSGGACGGLTVITGSGADIWCTFHIDTDATPSAMTATNGIQARARTVLPTERGLTRPPSPTSRHHRCQLN
ncbi:Uncharacterised protein [Mycobacteroides abscessus subsp. abscessus]|nr:Uncharacterised protein [Mycobacteroides abscessus subsp. abscessus]